jgi:glycosyltransferase involved in cell wall biosynthesis
VLVNLPAQYYVEGYRLLHRQPGVRTRVYFWDARCDGGLDPGFARHVRWNVDLHSGYEWWSPPEGLPAWRRIRAILRQLREDRPDVVLAQGWANPIACAGMLYARLTRTPLVFHGDTNNLATEAGRWRRLRRFAHRQVLRGAAALSTGGFNREFYLAHGMPSDRIHAGVFPIDLDSFTNASTRAGATPVIGYVGKLIPRKGVADLLHAAALLDQDQPWELVLAGDGALRRELEELAGRLGLAHRVRFVGFCNVDELAGAVAGMDIVVLPSHAEPRGAAAVEAMAAGAAVVVSSATGVWGPGDVLEHGESGLVFPAGNVPALARCLRRLLDDSELRHRLAERGRLRAQACGPDRFAVTAAAALAAAAAGRPAALTATLR